MRKLTFSQRIGVEPVRDAFQYRSMDRALQNALWDALTMAVLDDINAVAYDYRKPGNWIQPLVRFIWIEWLKQPIDTIPHEWYDTCRAIRQNYFASDWAQVYSLLEVMADHLDTTRCYNLKKLANIFMEREKSGYRFVGDDILPITDENEISAINEALSHSPAPVTSHLQRAVKLLGEKPNPDYRNSIKESILAVEAAARGIIGKAKATLGEAVKQIKPPLPSVLEKAFLKLYGYTSDEGGIRHSLTDSTTTVNEPEARFMLIACSAFVNYLRVRSNKGLP